MKIKNDDLDDLDLRQLTSYIGDCGGAIRELSRIHRVNAKFILLIYPPSVEKELSEGKPATRDHTIHVSGTGKPSMEVLRAILTELLDRYSESNPDPK